MKVGGASFGGWRRGILPEDLRGLQRMFSMECMQVLDNIGRVGKGL